MWKQRIFHFHFRKFLQLEVSVKTTDFLAVQCKTQNPTDLNFLKGMLNKAAAQAFVYCVI